MVVLRIRNTLQRQLTAGSEGIGDSYSLNFDHVTGINNDNGGGYGIDNDTGHGNGYGYGVNIPEGNVPLPLSPSPPSIPPLQLT